MADIPNALQYLRRAYQRGLISRIGEQIDPDQERPTQQTNQPAEEETTRNADETYAVNQKARIPFNVSNEYSQFLLNINSNIEPELPENLLREDLNIIGVETELLDWKDDFWSNLQILNVEHYNDAIICNIGEVTFAGIHGELTRETLMGIMILSYNLRDVNGNHLMDNVPNHLINAENLINEDDLSTEVLAVGPNRDMTPLYEEDIPIDHQISRSAKAYCYLAASYLRLFTKAPSNFLKIGDHLRSRFENFYAFPLPFEEFHPSSETINAMRKQFDLDDRLKRTLYVILYCSKNRDQRGAQLKNFLFQLHLNFTGMHSLNLLGRILEFTGLNSNQVLKNIYIPAFHKQYLAITAVGRMIRGGRGYEKEMWKCARVFDHRFLSSLQTKNCTLFCLTLTYMVYEYGGDNEKGVLDIEQLKHTGLAEKKLAYALAKFGVMRLNRLRLGGNLQGIGTAAHL